MWQYWQFIILFIHSLSIQEVHEWPQHVVRVGVHLVFVVVIERPFDLVQQGRHLSHAIVDAALETTEEKENDQSAQIHVWSRI